MEHLFFFSGSLTAFFLVLLFSKRNKALYDWLLTGWLAVILFHIAVFYISFHSPDTFLLEISSAAVFLNGPVLWLYTRSLFRSRRFSGRLYFIHFLPFLVNIAVVLPYILQNNLAPFSDEVRIFLAWIKLGSIFMYSMLAAFEIRRSQKIAEENFSNAEIYHVKWLQMAIYAVICVWCIGFITQLIFQSGISDILPVYEDAAINIAVSIFVIVMGYYGFKQAPVFIDDLVTISPDNLHENAQDEVGNSPEKYRKSAIDSENLAHYTACLEELMSEEKLYTDAGLTLQQLAARLILSPNQLSQIINRCYQKNFYEFINTYRVEEVKRLLRTDAVKQKTLLGIGLDAGFNSKASFNRYFKKQTGLTPSAYFQEISGAPSED